jgi:DNA repair photolyase
MTSSSKQCPNAAPANELPRVHLVTLRHGIRRTPKFERKGLAQYAVNAGTKCSHDCLYCSTGTVLRRHDSFVEAGESPFDFGYCIVDPDTPERVAADAKRIRPEQRGMVQLSTFVDAWAPEAQKYDLGRRCLEAILNEGNWSVRILTKNSAVAQDFDYIAKHRDRVTIGISLTATLGKADRIAVVEPNASPIAERIAALKLAHRRGLRVYGMLCPLLPKVVDSAADIRELVDTVLDLGAETVFAEPINARGGGLRLTAEALRTHGYQEEADAIDAIRNRKNWSSYTRTLLSRIQEALRARHAIEKLRFLLYPASLQPGDLRAIQKADAGVCWLGK